MKKLMLFIVVIVSISCTERIDNNLKLKDGVYVEKIDSGLYKYIDGDIACYRMTDRSISCIKNK